MAGLPRPALTRYAVGVGLSSWVAEHRQPIRTDDYAAACREAGVAPVTGALAFPYWLGVPMIAGDMVVGVLALRSATRPFSEADARLLTNIAGLAALTVRSARLHEATTHAYDQLSRAQEQLAQSRKMEAIGRLAGGVAHDFNNLLTVIKGRSQLILDRLEPEHPLRRQISLIEQMAERAAALTRQLLAFSRRQTLEPRVLSINLVVQGLAPMLGRLLGEDIELVVGLDPTLAVVRADPNQLEQVILNLVANARDAMPDGGRLTIETANAELTEDSIEPPHDVRPGPYVRLTVRDSGVGMDIATQARLFEPFFTTKEVGKGTGLGLATVYGIVQPERGHDRGPQRRRQRQHLRRLPAVRGRRRLARGGRDGPGGDPGPEDGRCCSSRTRTPCGSWRGRSSRSAATPCWRPGTGGKPSRWRPGPRDRSTCS